METLFWIFVGIVFYTYFGYGILLFLLVKIKERFFPAKTATFSEDLPDVTLLIAAYNEEAVIREKMANCRTLDYPAGKLKIYWVTDGSNDASNDMLAEFPEVRILFQPERQGKTAALNRAVPFVESPIVAFTDANTMLNEMAILEMAKAFANPRVGCVAGEKRIDQSKVEGATAGEGIYWKYESTLKALDDRLYSAIGAAGELFAIRTALFESMPTDTLLDDFMLSMRIAQKGYKIAYCRNAFAIEDPSANMQEEEKRKIRISAGGLQAIYRLRSLLNPFKYGILSVQYVSHRVLRWSLTPILFFLLYPINLFLVLTNQNFLLYGGLSLLQTLFYAAAIWGKRNSVKQVKSKLFYIPYYFLFMNTSVFKGIRYLRKKKGSGVWEKVTRA